MDVGLLPWWKLSVVDAFFWQSFFFTSGCVQFLVGLVSTLLTPFCEQRPLGSTDACVVALSVTLASCTWLPSQGLMDAVAATSSGMLVTHYHVTLG